MYSLRIVTSDFIRRTPTIAIDNASVASILQRLHNDANNASPSSSNGSAPGTKRYLVVGTRSFTGRFNGPFAGRLLVYCKTILSFLSLSREKPAPTRPDLTRRFRRRRGLRKFAVCATRNSSFRDFAHLDEGRSTPDV